MIDINLFDEDFIYFLIKSIKLTNFHYKDILKFRCINLYFRDYINTLFSNIKCSIDTYCYNWIPEGCIICKKINANNTLLKTDNQSIDPT